MYDYEYDYGGPFICGSREESIRVNREWRRNQEESRKSHIKEWGMYLQYMDKHDAKCLADIPKDTEEGQKMREAMRKMATDPCFSGLFIDPAWREPDWYVAKPNEEEPNKEEPKPAVDEVAVATEATVVEKPTFWQKLGKAWVDTREARIVILKGFGAILLIYFGLAFLAMYIFMSCFFGSDRD